MHSHETLALAGWGSLHHSYIVFSFIIDEVRKRRRLGATHGDTGPYRRNGADSWMVEDDSSLPIWKRQSEGGKKPAYTPK